MLGSAAHEFRNPLSSIISMLQIMEAGVKQSFKHYLQIAKSSADLLLFLSNDILDYAQIESGKLRLSFYAFNFYKTCKEVIELMQFKASSKNLNIVLSPLINNHVHIRSDENRFKQVLINLISNAIKYSENGTITISGRIEQRMNKYLFVSVEDKGVGIPADQIGNLFNLFGKLDDPN